MTDGTTCPFCGDVLDGVTCGRRVECFDQALKSGLVVETEETPEEIAEAEAWIEAHIRDGEEHGEWLKKQEESMND